jgi:DNA-directed RNA polymerase specialized sigma24 family protein
VLAQLKRIRSASVDAAEELAAEVDVDLDQKILVEQIMTRMDPENRRIAQLLILGYSFEEIAKQDGTASNILRSRYSKQLARIRLELDEIPRE